jgi:hypothetical protein
MNHVVEGRIDRRIEVMERRWRRRKQLLGVLKEMSILEIERKLYTDLGGELALEDTVDL